MDAAERIRKFVFDAFFPPPSLQDETSLLGSGVVDSTGMLEIIVFLEKDFAIGVADTEVIAENFDSISKLTVYVERKLAVRPIDAPVQGVSGANDAAPRLDA